MHLAGAALSIGLPRSRFHWATIRWAIDYLYLCRSSLVSANPYIKAFNKFTGLLEGSITARCFPFMWTSDRPKMLVTVSAARACSRRLPHVVIWVCTPSLSLLCENCPDKCNHKSNASAVNSMCQNGLQSVERGLLMTDDAGVWKTGSRHIIIHVALRWQREVQIRVGEQTIASRAESPESSLTVSPFSQKASSVNRHALLYCIILWL